MRKWLAGWCGQFSVWWARLADVLHPTYSQRHRVDITTVRPGTFSIPSGAPSPELLDALERVRQRRNVAYIRR